MPLKNIDYSKTIIYKIVCNDLNIKDCYVGHTTDFTRRKNGHKKCCSNPNNNSYNLKIYKTIRENGGIDNWTMIMIENYPCNNGDEARARERYYYETLNPTLNIQYPGRTSKEYDDGNKDKKKNIIRKIKKKLLKRGKNIVKLIVRN